MGSPPGTTPARASRTAGRTKHRPTETAWAICSGSNSGLCVAIVMPHVYTHTRGASSPDRGKGSGLANLRNPGHMLLTVSAEEPNPAAVFVGQHPARCSLHHEMLRPAFRSSRCGDSPHIPSLDSVYTSPGRLHTAMADFIDSTTIAGTTRKQRHVRTQACLSFCSGSRGGPGLPRGDEPSRRVSTRRSSEQGHRPPPARYETEAEDT